VDRLHGRIEGFSPRVFVRVRAERQRRNGVGAQCVGADGERELGVRSSGQRYDTIARQGSARGDDGSGTCKTTGSAR
jgi:hypothetical protein